MGWILNCGMDPLFSTDWPVRDGFLPYLAHFRLDWKLFHLSKYVFSWSEQPANPLYTLLLAFYIYLLLPLYILQQCNMPTTIPPVSLPLLLITYLPDQLPDRLSSWPTNRPYDQLTNQTVNHSTDDWLTDHMIDLLISCLTGRSAVWLTDWLTNWMAEWLTDWNMDKAFICPYHFFLSKKNV